MGDGRMIMHPRLSVFFSDQRQEHPLSTRNRPFQSHCIQPASLDYDMLNLNSMFERVKRLKRIVPQSPSASSHYS